jgi:hypothetical protein
MLCQHHNSIPFHSYTIRLNSGRLWTHHDDFRYDDFVASSSCKPYTRVNLNEHTLSALSSSNRPLHTFAVFAMSSSHLT